MHTNNHRKTNIHETKQTHYSGSMHPVGRKCKHGTGNHAVGKPDRDRRRSVCERRNDRHKGQTPPRRNHRRTAHTDKRNRRHDVDEGWRAIQPDGTKRWNRRYGHCRLPRQRQPEGSHHSLFHVYQQRNREANCHPQHLLEHRQREGLNL